MNFTKSSLWAPDYIMESSGIACGDKLSLYAYKEENNIYFSFLCTSCSVSKKVADYLENELSGQTESEIFEFIQRLRNKKYLDGELWLKAIPNNRQSCMESPISLLSGLFAQTDTCNINDRDVSILSCDACVSTHRVNWDASNVAKRKSHSMKEIFAQAKRLDDEEEILLQKLGLAVLNDTLVNEFKRIMKNTTFSMQKKIKKLRLPSAYYNNAIKYGVNLDNEIKALASKQILSMMVANEEINGIMKKINERGLRIDAVKGGKTNQYYPQNRYRTHMDYDFLAANLEDAFYFIDYLVNCRAFRLVVGGSVPFSFKTVLDNKKIETLTGHIHLEKILQDTFQVVIDINMGGFPLGRTGLMKCNDLGKLEVEDLICITVAHLFKHEHAFIKDINDLYYLLNNDVINQEKLLRKFNEYNLKNLFYIAYRFMKRELGLKREYSVRGNHLMLLLSKKNWPYSRKRHFYIKTLDMFHLGCKQYGIIKGMTETRKQLCGISGKMKTSRYSKLCEIFNQRTYLYPITFFNSYHNLKKDNSIEWIDNILGVYHDVLILPIGIFIIQGNGDKAISRKSIEDDIKYIFEKLDLSESDCNFTYIMEARKDTWLY